MSEWYYSDKEERRGPISLEMLQRLIQNGLIADDELAWTEGMADWKPIASVPQLRSSIPRDNEYRSPIPRSSFNPDRDVSRSRDYEERSSYDEGRRRYSSSGLGKAPHRGGLILGLGLVGFLACPLVAFVAFYMGKTDLEEMRLGRMDHTGEGSTRAGYILAIVTIVLFFIQLAVIGLMVSVMVLGK